MSNSGELAAAEAKKHKPRILVVDDQVRAGRTLASVMGMVSGLGYPCSIGKPMIPRSQAKRHRRHQGAKERERRARKEARRMEGIPLTDQEWSLLASDGEHKQAILFERTLNEDEHPDGYDGPCLCRECRSYGD